MKSFKTFITESKSKEMDVSLAEKLYPSIDDLSDKDLKTILKIKSLADINKLRYEDWWMDDFEECYGIEVNGVKIGLWWYGKVWGDFLRQIEIFDKLHSAMKKHVKGEVYDIIEQEKDTALIDPDHRHRVKKLEREMETIDKMKPETQKRWKSIITNA